MNLKQTSTRNGLTLIEVMIVIVIISVLVAIYLPELARRHRRSSRIGCANNLKQLGLAYRVWALDNGDKFPMQVSVTNGGTMELVESGVVYPHFQVMSNELNTPKILFCPQESNRKRVMATTFYQSVPPNATGSMIPFTSDKNVSYFVGVDAVDASPQMIISGDDNFTVSGKRPKSGLLLLRTNSPVAWTKERHVNQGYYGLADGSVMGVSSPRWQQALVASGVATNRLAMP